MQYINTGYSYYKSRLYKQRFAIYSRHLADCPKQNTQPVHSTKQCAQSTACSVSSTEQTVLGTMLSISHSLYSIWQNTVVLRNILLLCSHTVQYSTHMNQSSLDQCETNQTAMFMYHVPGHPWRDGGMTADHSHSWRFNSPTARDLKWKTMCKNQQYSPQYSEDCVSHITIVSSRGCSMCICVCHTCQPREKFSRGKQRPAERSKAGFGRGGSTFSETCIANGAIWVIPELHLWTHC